MSPLLRCFDCRDLLAVYPAEDGSMSLVGACSACYERRRAKREYVTDDEIREWRRMYECGLSLDAISLLRSRPRMTIYSALKRSGVAFRRRGRGDT